MGLVAGLIILGVLVYVGFKILLYIILPMLVIVVIYIALDLVYLQPFFYKMESNWRPSPEKRTESEKKRWTERWDDATGLRRVKPPKDN